MNPNARGLGVGYNILILYLHLVAALHSQRVAREKVCHVLSKRVVDAGALEEGECFGV